MKGQEAEAADKLVNRTLLFIVIIAGMEQRQGRTGVMVMVEGVELDWRGMHSKLMGAPTFDF